MRFAVEHRGQDFPLAHLRVRQRPQDGHSGRGAHQGGAGAVAAGEEPLQAGASGREVAAQRGARGVGTGGAVHTTAGVGSGGGQVQAGDGGLGASGAGQGPEEGLLVQGGGAAVDGAADQVAVQELQCRGARTRRARISERKPGAKRSAWRSMRSAMSFCSLAFHCPVMPSPPASARMSERARSRRPGRESRGSGPASPSAGRIPHCRPTRGRGRRATRCRPAAGGRPRRETPPHAPPSAGTSHTSLGRALIRRWRTATSASTRTGDRSCDRPLPSVPAPPVQPDSLVTAEGSGVRRAGDVWRRRWCVPTAVGLVIRRRPGRGQDRSAPDRGADGTPAARRRKQTAARAHFPCASAYASHSSLVRVVFPSAVRSMPPAPPGCAHRPETRRRPASDAAMDREERGRGMQHDLGSVRPWPDRSLRTTSHDEGA